MVRALSVDQFAFGIEPLTPDAVKTLVSAEIDFPSVEDLLQYVLNDFDMFRVGRPNELVVFDIEFWPGLPEKPAYPVDVCLGLNSCSPGRLDDFIPVLVGPGEKEGLESHEFVKAVHYVGDNCSIGVADMRFGINVINRRCYIKSIHLPSFLVSGFDDCSEGLESYCLDSEHPHSPRQQQPLSRSISISRPSSS